MAPIDPVWTMIGTLSGAIVAAGVLIGFIWKHIKPRITAIRQFWEHLVGVEANEVTGQTEVVGLFARLDMLEKRLDARLDQQDDVLSRQDSVLETIRHEVEFNNGSSVKDAVRRIETALSNHLKEQQ